MKKILVKSLVAIYAILFLVHSAEAHNSSRLVATGHDSPNVNTVVVDMSNVNKKAANDFKERFGNPEGTRWFSDKNGFTSYFKVDGFTNTVCYDKKGNWMYSVILYNESRLPKDVRANVKSVYYDMAITLVKEIQTVKGKGYVIHLEDKTAIRIVKVNVEGEMETIQEIIK
jgi:hypothetical protein